MKPGVPAALASAALALCAAPAAAVARATFTVVSIDSPGQGFNDPRQATPVGGNDGRTVGQQRMNAFRHAADLWAQALDGPIPVVIEASFAPLDCSPDRVTLGNARPTLFVARSDAFPELPDRIWIPLALANQMTRRDLYPDMADIEATFNGGLAECAGAENDWYYGLDAKGGDRTDLVSVVLHELAHGLGFNSLVDPDTGAAPQGLMDVFSTHVFDVTRGRSWADLTATERAASAGNVRRLVWSGENVTRMAPAVLAKGSPLVGFAPVPPPGLRGFVSEAEFGARASARPARGRLVAISPAAGCSISADLSGAVALFVAPFCPPIQEAARAEAAGAIGALVTDGRDVVPPFSMGAPLAHRSAFPVTIPVLGIADRDAALLAGVRDLTAEIGSEADRLVGADEGGRVYLFASDPVFPASSVSHWDTLARPSLLEEPESTTDVSHDLRLEQALLRDIGWTSLCGNGALDAGEECDSGSDNSDFTPGSCRSTCRRAHCGDRVIDAEETCDEGVENGWPATTCSATCTPQTSGGPGGGGGGGAGGGGGGGGDGCGPCGVGGGWTSAGSWPWLAVLALYERHRRRRRRDRQRAGSST